MNDISSDGQLPGWGEIRKSVIVALIVGIGAIAWGGYGELAAINVAMAEQRVELRSLAEKVQNGTTDRYTGRMAAVDKEAATGVHNQLTQTIESLTKRLDEFSRRTEGRIDALSDGLADTRSRVRQAEDEHKMFRRLLPMDVPQ